MTDKKYGDALERLITGLGVKNDQLIYTLHPSHKIPMDASIYDYLRENFGRKMFMIILWSNDYLDSPACLNEVGTVLNGDGNYKANMIELKNKILEIFNLEIDEQKWTYLLDEFIESVKS